MKLIIKSGESVEHAIKYLTDFLSQRKEEYPLLKSNMNIYVALEGFGHRICPENEKEYILTGEEVIDTEQINIAKSKEAALKGWKAYVSYHNKQVLSASRDVNVGIQYLETAEKKGLKPETIERRKHALEEYRCELKKSQELAAFIHQLDSLVTEGQVKWFFEKHTQKSTYYIYNFTPNIIFEYMNGDVCEDWYFAGYMSQYETPFGRLCGGLPKGYIKQQEKIGEIDGE